MPLSAAFIVLVSLGSWAIPDQSGRLEEALKARYELTKTGIDRVRITQAGTVLVVRQDGISADLASDFTFLNNKVTGGRIAQAGGLVAALQDKETSRVLKAGEKVYVFKIEVKTDEIRFFLLTCDTASVTVKGSTKQTRYKALLSFQFPKGFLEATDADTVKKAIDAVVVPEAEAQASNTKTIELGQTQQQVEAALGRPDRIVNLGQKQIYVYKDMKVVFVDGKVTDVQ